MEPERPVEKSVTITMTAEELRALMEKVATDSIAEHEKAKFKSHLSALSAETTRALITGLSPDSEMGRGKQYLLNLLDSYGLEALEQFVDKGLEGIDEDGGLDFERHFSPREKKLFAEDIPNLNPLKPLPTVGSTNRRLWLKTMGLAGAGLFVEGVNGIAKTILDTHEPPKPAEGKWKHLIHQVTTVVDDWIAPITLVIIGVHYFHDVEVEQGRMLLENIAEKLGHLEYAIDELAVQSKQAKKSMP